MDRAQGEALDTLASILPPSFYLAGGVAVAAHLGHRVSRDLDLFASTDPTTLLPDLVALPGVKVSSTARGTVYLTMDVVPVSLIQYRYPLLQAPTRIAGFSVVVASTSDLACMKLSAIAGRGAGRDFWDLHALIHATRRPLAEYLGDFGHKYAGVDPGHIVRSLVYFADAEADPLPLGLSPAHWQTIQQDFRSWVRELVLPPAPVTPET